MGTFRDWLRDQEQREDQTGWMAKYWKELPDTPRLSSPNSIERHLEQRSLFGSQPGLKEAWDSTYAEYRQHRIVVAAVDAGVMSPGQVVERAAQAGMDAAEAATARQQAGDPVTLELLDHKLTMIMTALGIKGGLRPEQAMIMPAVPLEPIPWQELWEQAQREAADG